MKRLCETAGIPFFDLSAHPRLAGSGEWLLADRVGPSGGDDRVVADLVASTIREARNTPSWIFAVHAIFAASAARRAEGPQPVPAPLWPPQPRAVQGSFGRGGCALPGPRPLGGSGNLSGSPDL